MKKYLPFHFRLRSERKNVKIFFYKAIKFEKPKKTRFLEKNPIKPKKTQYPRVFLKKPNILPTLYAMHVQSNKILHVLCKSMKQRPTFNFDYGYQRIFPQFECYFVKIVIEWLCLWWNQLLVLILNVMSLLVM